MFDGKCSCICFIHLLRVSYIFDTWVDCKSVNIFCISEMCRDFNFILSYFNFIQSFSFLVSFGEVKETVTQKSCKVLRH
jgi:hypothetical protein